MKVKCNLTTKEIEGFSRKDNISFNSETHIVLDVDYVPNMEKERLNNTNDGLRPVTQTEINEEKDIEKADKVETELGGDNIRVLVDVFKQVVMDGTISTKTPDEIIAQAKSMRRAEL